MQLRFMLQGKKKKMGRHDFQFFIVYLTVVSHYILKVLYICYNIYYAFVRKTRQTCNGKGFNCNKILRKMGFYFAVE